MQPPPTEEDATLAFEEGFSQLAHRTFTTKFPELVERIVTFKILRSDLETNSGIGAFILDIDGETVFIPVVLANNQVKPLEILYFKDKDIFLPLTEEWIGEIARGSLDQLGQGVETPKTLSPDQDIRNVIVPPTVGRYAYAAEGASGIKLAQFLSSAPNHVKEAFRMVLDKNHDILKYAFENFDREMLLEALRPTVEKEAEEKEVVTLLTPNESADTFKKTFGQDAGNAWQEAVKKGYVLKDTRENVNRAVETEEPLKLINAQENGFYRVCMQDGSRKLALVISDPQPTRSELEAGKRTDLTKRPDPYKLQRKKTDHTRLIGEEWPTEGPEYTNQRWLIYTEGGDIIVANRPPVGEWVPAEEITGNLAKILSDAETPVSQGYGFFACSRGGKFRGTSPIEIESVSTGSDGVRRARTFMDGVFVTDPNSPIKEIVAPNKSNVTYIPVGYKFIKGNRQYDAKLLEGAEDTLSHLENLQKVGALKVKLIDAGAGLFSIGGLESMDKLATVKALIADLQLRQGEAEELMEKAASKGQALFYVVNNDQLREFAQLTKEAQGMPPPMPPQAGAMPGPQGAMPMGGPPEGVPMGPEMMAPEMMAPPAPPEPPAPSPVELAVDEIGAEVTQQSAEVTQQLAEEQRELGNKMNILQAVKDRANQIAGEMGGAPPVEAPAMPEQVPPAVPAGPGEEVPPAGPAGAMPPAEAAGAMPPAEAAGAMPPAEAAGAMPPEAQTPGAMEMANTAEPMMAEAAGLAEKLKDPSAFEATSIGSMAADSDLRNSVLDYMPVLEESLDNLGRTLFTMWIEEPKLREEMGEEDFADLETQLLTVFQNLGDLILKVNQTAMPMEPEGVEA
jgi:hypothetical protein